MFINKKIFPKLTTNFYRILAYTATALTGFTALCAQVIWQKHLAILTGSDARSLSLVVAIFLLGLAGGYYVFGLLTEKRNKLSRFLLLKYYGYLELATGLYIGLFPLYFGLLKTLSFHSANFFIIDVLITLLALLIPTFLMGASIPLLTATLPEDSTEINTVHAKVYGWNSLGACLGTLFSGFYLIPVFGLDLSLYFVGLLNVLIALVFIGNKLEGLVQKKEEPKRISSPLPNSFFIIFVFFTGALILSLEVIFVRILNLSLGSGVYNFPIVLSIFIGGLALGSLSLKKQKISISFFVKQLFIILFLLQFTFYTAPYWSIWFNHIRISLSTILSNYFIFYILIFLFLSLFLLPTVFFMGRLLPLAYSFLNKTKDNYGKVCGSLYFFNTLGAVFGAIIIGYLALYLFNIDVLFKANIYIFFLLILTMLIYVKKKAYFVILSVLGLTLLILPTQWDRSGHEVGYFRIMQYTPNIHFKKLFFLPKNRRADSQVTFFKDGPNSTVSLISYPNEYKQNPNIQSRLKDLFSVDLDTYSSYSIVVNGKSDSNSLGDFSTILFMLPYLHSPQKADLQTAFIGLGTGISAGSYTLLDDVKDIHVVEISNSVIKAIKTTDPKMNFQVMQNKKVKIIETDAFKYFTKNKKKFDIIISEPSNPWVVGVENLFTSEFYQLIAQNLRDKGVFGQWLHTYDMDIGTVEIIIKTINQVFPYAHLYKVGHRDLLIVASVNKLPPLSKKKFNHPFVKKAYKAMGVKKAEDLYLSQVFDANTFQQIAQLSLARVNSLNSPQIIYRTNKSMFLKLSSDPFILITKRQVETKNQTKKMKVFYHNYKDNWMERCLPLAGFNFLCALMRSYTSHWKEFKNEKKSYIERLPNYLFLRRRGLIAYNKYFMNSFYKESLKKKNRNLDSLSGYVSELMKVKEYKKAEKTTLVFKKNSLIQEIHYKNFKLLLEDVRKIHKRLEQN